MGDDQTRCFQEQTLTLSETLFTKPDRMVIIFKTPDATSPSQLGISHDMVLWGLLYVR